MKLNLTRICLLLATLYCLTQAKVELQAASSSEETAVRPPENLHCDFANPVLSYFLKLANRNIEKSKLFTDKDMDLFGKPNNRLDPMDFNGQMTGKVDGQVCTPKKCVTIFGKTICTPEICVAGEADAILYTMSGLKTLRAKNATCTDIKYNIFEPSRIDATGILSLGIDSLRGTSHETAHGHMGKLVIPVSSSGNFTIVEIKPVVTVDVVLSFTSTAEGKHIFQVEEASSKNITLPYKTLLMHINHLGAFDKIISSITNSMAKKIKKRFDVDGEIAHAVNNALNGVIVEAIPQINAMLKLMPF